MTWFNILKAELAEPIADVTTGKSPTDECCEETIEYMKSKGRDSITFFTKADENKPISPDNVKYISEPFENIPCDYIYGWLDQNSRYYPGGPSQERRMKKKGRGDPKYIKIRMAKMQDFLDYWDKCIEEKGTEGVEA